MRKQNVCKRRRTDIIHLQKIGGIAGIVSIVPAFAKVFIYIFALGQIAWFVWMGIVLFRSSANSVTEDLQQQISFDSVGGST